MCPVMVLINLKPNALGKGSPPQTNLVGKKNSLSQIQIDQRLSWLELIIWLVVEPTHLKNMLVKMGIFPKIGMKIKNI